MDLSICVSLALKLAHSCSQMQRLTWGQWNDKAFALRHPGQVVLGADVLYASKGAYIIRYN